MREIKFRAWDKTTKTMIREYAYVSKTYGEMHVASFHSSAYNEQSSPDLILSQYTGLKDKNGKEIYEGDILSSKNDGSDGCDIWDYEDYSNKIVEWSDKYHCWHGLPDFDAEDLVHSMKYIEIIGNIHETPELLDKK